MLRRGQGCPECHGLGYKGRVAVLEMMVITPEIEALMTRTGTTTAQDLSSTAMKSGMIPLIEDGIRKAAAGLTTVLEIMRLSEVKIDQRE